MKTKLLNLLAMHLGLAALAAQPVITNQPQSQTNITGTTATFFVGAIGAEPLSYQWRSHSGPNSYTNIPFGTEATLGLTNVQQTSLSSAIRRLARHNSFSCRTGFQKVCTTLAGLPVRRLR